MCLFSSSSVLLHLEQISARHTVFNKQLLRVIFYSFKITPFVFDCGINTRPTVGNPENIGTCKEENQNSLNFHSFDKHILTHISISSFSLL